MSPVDLACVAILSLAAVGGAFTGALPQCGRLAGAVGGWLGASALGPLLEPLLASRVPAFAARPLSSIAAFVLCAAAAWLAVRVGFRLAGGTAGGGADRGLGALLGGAKAAVVLWVLLSALAVWGRPIQAGSLCLDGRSSDLVALAREHSALGGARHEIRR
jgi:membrane protein required for colicin V production